MPSQMLERFTQSVSNTSYGLEATNKPPLKNNKE